MRFLIVLGRSRQIAEAAIRQTRDLEMQAPCAGRRWRGLLRELLLASSDQIFGVLDAGNRGLILVARSGRFEHGRRVARRLVMRAEGQRLDHRGTPCLAQLAHRDRNRHV